MNPTHWRHRLAVTPFETLRLAQAVTILMATDGV
jgi:hypothetical protein